MRSDQPLDQRNHRVVRRGDAKDDLVARIVEREGRGQRFLDVVLDAADRTQYADGRLVGGRDEPAKHTLPNKDNQDAREVRGHADDKESNTAMPVPIAESISGRNGRSQSRL